MRLRSAAPEDADAVAAVFLTARAGMTYLPDLHTDAETRAFFAEVVGRGGVTVAEDEHGVIGFMAVAHGWLDHLYVAPSHQRRGVGSALLRRLQAREAARPLGVFQGNTGAIALYERHGFVIAERTEGAGNEER